MISKAPSTLDLAPNTNTVQLFTQLQIRQVELPNRIAVSPMCQYSSEDGFANDWHLVHLGSRAIGGAGLVIAEATAVEARGRISPRDLGIWKDEHVPQLKRIATFLKEHGAVPGIQLAHAGRKASTDAPWRGGHAVPLSRGGWEPVAPSPIPFDTNFAVPCELRHSDIEELLKSFMKAAERALEAGFQVIEIHGAHGYLIHEFLSPFSNQRSDEYGGSLENRMRFALQVTSSIRRVWPETLPLFMRISATDWSETGGWTPDDSVQLAKHVKTLGVDVVDCSSGGNLPRPCIPLKPGYQVPFSERIRREAGILTGAVGLITDPKHAEEIIANGSADLVLLARELLRDPYWPIHAARKLGAEMPLAVQYARAFPNFPKS